MFVAQPASGRLGRSANLLPSRSESVVRGFLEKVMTHRMFGVLALTVDQLLRLSR